MSGGVVVCARWNVRWKDRLAMSFLLLSHVGSMFIRHGQNDIQKYGASPG